MAFGQPSFIAVHLLGDESATLVLSVRSESVTYGNTVGPFLGIGGSAMTPFTITELRIRGDLCVYFADERFLGWSASRYTSDAFPRLDVRTPGLNTDLETCPVVLR